MVEHGHKQIAKMRLDALGASGLALGGDDLTSTTPVHSWFDQPLSP
mgnify:CR=1 FL=1